MGALGGKILGAGSGGFLLIFAYPDDHKEIIQRMYGTELVDFDFEPEGSKIIYEG